jgi:hypothetical protein
MKTEDVSLSKTYFEDFDSSSSKFDGLRSELHEIDR